MAAGTENGRQYSVFFSTGLISKFDARKLERELPDVVCNAVPQAAHNGFPKDYGFFQDSRRRRGVVQHPRP